MCHTLARDEGLGQFMDSICKVPKLLRSVEEDERFMHRDLDGLSISELRREREKTRFRLFIDDDPPNWLMERLDVVDGRLRYGAL